MGDGEKPYGRPSSKEEIEFLQKENFVTGLTSSLLLFIFTNLLIKGLDQNNKI